jgi:hypothetical protein
MPKTQQPGSERKARSVQRMAMDNAGTDLERMEGNITEDEAIQRKDARTKVAVGQDLFNRPGYPTGLPPGVDAASLQDPGEEAVTPEEQQQYDKIVRFAAQLIYKNPRQTLAAMNQADLPIHQAVGRHAANIAQVIENTAKANKEQLDPDVLWHAGSEVIEMLMDLGVQAKAFPLDPESEQYQQEAAMALMEAEKAVGERALKDPKKGRAISAEASDVWAWNIAKEVDSGQASPQYTQMVEQSRQANSPVRAGVQAALRRPQ